MRIILAFAFLFMLNMTAIGSPEPDRQNPDLTALYDAVSFEMAVVANEVEMFYAQTVLISGMEADFPLVTTDLLKATTLVTTRLVLDNSDVAINDLNQATDSNLSNPILLIKDPTDEVVEDSSKPRDRYRLPIWEYSPSIEPPSRS